MRSPFAFTIRTLSILILLGQIIPSAASPALSTTASTLYLPMLEKNTPLPAPQVWFAPLPPMPTHSGRPYIGSADFMDLFTPEADWPAAATRVTVFKLYGEWVAYHATDAQLAQVITDLKRRHIALAVEAGPLNPTETCGQGIEGFAGTAEGRLIASRIQNAGGVLDYLAMDEPYFFAHIYSGVNACHWTAEKIAAEVQDYIDVLQGYFPNLVVGDTEPLPYGTSASDYQAWIDAFYAVNGYHLPFIHLDFDFYRGDWPQVARQLEAYSLARQIDFGIIFMGSPDSGTEWVSTAWARLGEYEGCAGGHADHVLFQSWHDQPDYVLPETNPNTFTHLVNRYARTRTRLTTSISTPDSDGQITISGVLTTPRDGAVSGAPIVIQASMAYTPTIFAPPAWEISAPVTGPEGRFELTRLALPFGAGVTSRYQGSGTGTADGAAGYWPACSILPGEVALYNLARGQTVTASRTLNGSSPGFAVDGNAETTWGAGDFPVHWIEIDLGEPHTVVMIRLLVSQYPTGQTTHRIWDRTLAAPVLIEELTGLTQENQVLEVYISGDGSVMQRIRIETTSSPSWVGWREIEIVGY